MQLLIKDNISATWCRSDFQVALHALEGERVTVETDHLFRDQYNTAPIGKRRAKRLMAKVAKTHPWSACYFPQAYEILTGCGMRIMSEHVQRVVNDARQGRQRCNYCGKHSEAAGAFCPHCGKGGCLVQFDGNTFPQAK